MIAGSRVARRAGVVCLISSLAACSSGGSKALPTSTSSSSTPSTSAISAGSVAAAVRAFFASDGKPLLAFERATRELETGSAPQRDTCLRLTRQVLPKIIDDPNLLFPLTQRIPDPELASAFGQDVRLKLLVVLGCSAGSTPPTGNAADPKAYQSVRDFADGVKRLLARFAITA
jgi:hypothetical protein